MRKPIAMLLLLLWLSIWIIGVATLSNHLNALPRWLQPVAYIIAGIGWIFPLKPLFHWMNTVRDDDAS